MNKIWANRLIAGTKTWADVIKAGREDGVLSELKARVASGEITAENRPQGGACFRFRLLCHREAAGNGAGQRR